MLHAPRQVPSWLTFDVGQMISRLIIASFAFFAITACRKGANEKESRLIGEDGAYFTYAYTKAGQQKQVGTMNDEQINEVRVKLGAYRFPAREEILLRLIPRDFRGVPICFVDALTPDKQGRYGGNVSDYWLNSNHVLRVGVSYRRTESRIEWVQILTRQQAYKEKIRSPY